MGIRIRPLYEGSSEAFNWREGDEEQTDNTPANQKDKTPTNHTNLHEKDYRTIRSYSNVPNPDVTTKSPRHKEEKKRKT